MRITGSAQVLTNAEISLIIENALRILAEVGVRVPNVRMLDRLAEFGATVDLETQMACFPQALMTRFLDESERHVPDDRDHITFRAGAYPQYFMPADSRRVRPHTVETISQMTRLADYLDNIGFVYDGMGVPDDIPAPIQPLWMRLLVWKYTEKGGCGQVQLTRLCPYAVEMAELMAEREGGKVKDYAFLSIELISPLQFGKEEAEQFIFFWERGLAVHLGQILSSGGTAPATLAATVALTLAEQLFLNFLRRAFYGEQTLRMGNSATVLDMKQAVFRYGRPELGLTHLVMGHLARYLGASFRANSFLGDAKYPTCEMGMQKALNALPAIMAGTRSLGTLGLLSVDEIGSPLQLIIDNEYAGALRRFARGFDIDEESLAFDLIKEMGPGGLFTGTVHTVRHHRQEHWQPDLFSREMYNAWIAGEGKIDAERARDVYHEAMRTHDKVYVSEETEQALLEVIERARREPSGS
jgi:trimethylamine--corrinoid protein Co-methyltransferase